MLGPNDNQPTPEPVKAEVEVEQTAPVVMGETSLIRMAEVFQLDRLTDIKQYEGDLKRISDWAYHEGAQSLEDVIDRIRYLKARIGGAGSDSSVIKKMSRYAFLALEGKKIGGELKEMEAKS